MSKANRNRLVNALLFFAQNTKNAGKVKLFKLIYLLDFEHFRLTGRSVTGLNYEAWTLGPVPRDLKDEWKSGFAQDLAQLVHVERERVIDHMRETLVPNAGANFDDSYFTPRQIGIMHQLAARYGETYSPEMIDVTHEQNGAWSKIWRDGEGRNDIIPYELAATGENREEVLKAADDYSAYVRAAIAN